MKKIFLIISLLSLCGAVFAATSPMQQGTSIPSTMPTLDVVIAASNDITTCGFSLTYNSSAADHGLSNMTEKSFDNVRNYTGSVDEYDMRGEMSFYVWWQLFSASYSYNVKINLGNLSGAAVDPAVGNVTIPYTMTFTDPATSSSSSNTNGQTATLFTYTRNDDLTFGVRSVSVVTGNIRNALASKEYSATITLTVESI